MVGRNKLLRLQYAPLRSLPFGDIGADYVAIGNALPAPAIIAKIYNGTDIDLLISQDGSEDHDIIPSSATAMIDINTNHTSSSGLYLRKGDVLFAKRIGDVNPTTGSIFLTTWFIG